MTIRKTKTKQKTSALAVEYYFDQAKVDDVILWIETFCTHPVGDLQGQPLILPEWFKNDIIAPVFGWKKPNGYRKIQECYQEIGSGNAKSTLGTALALYCLCHDSQKSPRVYCVAGSKEQAGIIFNGAKLMVQQNDQLASAIKIFRQSMTIENDNGYGVLMAISADSDMQEGLNPTAVFFDEMHVQANSRLYSNLKKNFPKRKEPLLFVMTTAGVVFTFAHEYHEKAKKIKSGDIKAPGFHSAIYESDPESDDFDEEQIKKANPGWAYLNIDLLMQEMEEAKKSATALSAWRRYHLNKWVNASSTWLTDEQWMKGTACSSTDESDLIEYRSTSLSFDSMKGRKCLLGIDLSSNRDTASCAWVFEPINKDERVKILVRVYIPEDSLPDRIEKETPLYGEWEVSGEIVVTTGSRQDQDQIYADIDMINKSLKVEGVAYDPWNAGQIVSAFEKSGVETKAYKQDYPSMNMPMRQLDNALSKGMIEHGGQPVLRWHCSNTESRTRMIGGAEYIMPTKSSEMARIDAMVAVLIAYGLMIWKQKEAETKESSLQKTKGIMSIQLNRP